MGVGKPRSGAIYPAVFLTSAGVLMLQVALTRLFSFTLWYHFAYVVISLALLGYGASGALLSAFPGILRGNLGRTLFLCALGSAVLIPVSLLVYSHTPFYPLRLFVEEAQWWYLLAYYAAAGAPFFLAGVCIAGAISAASERVTRVYCADLVGAGLGAGLVVPLIWRLETPGVVMLASGLMAGAAVCWAIWWQPRIAAAPVVLIVALAVGGGSFWRSLEFHPSVDKQMAQLEAARAQPPLPGDGKPQSTACDTTPTSPARSTRLWRHLPRWTRWGAVFRVDVLDTADQVIRRFPSAGASARFHDLAPSFMFLPHDGDAAAVIYDGRDARALAMFDNRAPLRAIALPYVLLKRKAKVLVIGAGGGTDVLAALRCGAASITAVDLDPLTVRLVTRDLAEYAGMLHRRPGVSYLVGEGRSFVKRSRRKYDLIHNNSTDTLTAMGVGAYVLNENYLYTVEAFEEYLKRLDRNGILYLAHLSFDPRSRAFEDPQAMTRIAALREALLRRGASKPEDHIAVIWATGLMTYLTRPRPFSPGEVELLKRQCAENGFLPLHLPHHSLDSELSRYLRASPEARAEYVRSSPIVRDPPTDDAPFVWPHFKWRYMFGRAPTLDRPSVWTGQAVMLPLLSVAVLGSLVFILGPLALFRRRGIRSPAASGLAVYFAALGFGFMFIEISFIQKFVLFLGYPTYSLTVVLSALLVSSGVGSLSSQRLISRAERSLVWALGGLLVLGALYLVFGSSVFEAFLGYPLWVRVIIAVGLIAPLGFAMGMFFPTGVRVVNEVAPAFVPWAWGINASTSVVAAILAVMLAMTVGFRMVAILAFGIYVVGVAGLYWGHRRARTAAPLPRGSAATPAPATVNQ